MWVAGQRPALALAVGFLVAGCAAQPTDGTVEGAERSETLVMSDNAFDPQTWAIPGSGTYTLRNTGRGLHNLTVEEADIDVDVAAGSSQEVDIELDPGQYDMVCEYHVAQGMSGILVVGGG